MTHTPTPWAAGEDPIEDQSYKTRVLLPNSLGFYGTTIAYVNHNWNDAEHGERRISWKEAEANAARIVHCVNTHDALVKALEGCIPSGVCLSNSNIPDDTIVPIDATMGELRAVAAALALAKGEGE